MVIGLGLSSMKPAAKARVNNQVDLSSAKVVNAVTLKDIEDSEKTPVAMALCRCWKSKTVSRRADSVTARSTP